MPINLQSAANFWDRIKGDSATAGDGTANTSPARYDAWNSDIGSQDDAAASSDTGTFTLVALIKRLLGTKIPSGLTVTSTRLLVDGSGVTQPVSVPRAGSGTVSNASQQTNATGATYNTLASATCYAIEFINNTGTTIEYRRGGSGVAIPIFDKSSKLVIGIANANEIGIRRTDTSNTQVTIVYEVYA